MLPSARTSDANGVFKQVANNTCPAPDREWILEDLSPWPQQHTICGVSCRQRQLICSAPHNG